MLRIVPHEQKHVKRLTYEKYRDILRTMKNKEKVERPRFVKTDVTDEKGRKVKIAAAMNDETVAEWLRRAIDNQLEKDKV